MKRLHKTYDALKEHFSGSFHSTLWRVLVDGITRGKVACFVCNYSENGVELGLSFANEPGYCPCPCYFVDGNYDNVEKVLEQLNRMVFNMNEGEVLRIFTSSMRGNVQRDEL